MHIYILKLQRGKYYIGKSNQVKNRINEHFNSYGSGWTKKYKPVKVVETIKNCDKFDEDKYTLKYMEKYGINNVRGGSFTRIQLNANNISHIRRMINTKNENC